MDIYAPSCAHITFTLEKETAERSLTMKHVYEEPLLRLVGFRAAEGLTNSWQWDLAYTDDPEFQSSSDVEVDYTENPEGDF